MKKGSLLIGSIVILCSSLSINGVNKVITTPYKPSFHVTNPRLTCLIKSGLAGIGLGITAYLAGKKFLNKSYPISSILAGTAGFVTTLFNTLKSFLDDYRDCKKSPDILDSLLTETWRIRDYALHIKEEFELAKKEIFSSEHTLQQNINEFKDFIRNSAKKCPLFLLGECTSEECTLHRNFQPIYRGTFAKNVAESIIQIRKNGTSNDPIYYTSYGSGGMFQDLVNITAVLSQCPTASIVINLIDRQYTSYSLCLSDREIRENLELDIAKGQTLIKQWALKKEIPNDVNKEIMPDVVQMHEMCKQFIGWLRTTFPKSQLSLFIHDTTENYLNYINKNNVPYPDVIAAADIGDYFDNMNGSKYDYAVLCKAVLENKKTMHNICLMKSGETGADLVTFSLEGTQKKLETFQPPAKNEDKKSIVLYVAKEKIKPEMLIDSGLC